MTAVRTVHATLEGVMRARIGPSVIAADTRDIEDGTPVTIHTTEDTILGTIHISDSERKERPLFLWSNDNADILWSRQSKSDHLSFGAEIESVYYTAQTVISSTPSRWTQESEDISYHIEHDIGKFV